MKSMNYRSHDSQWHESVQLAWEMLMKITDAHKYHEHYKKNEYEQKSWKNLVQSSRYLV